MNKTIKANVESKCGVCEKSILVTDYGAGKCPFCGWRQGDVFKPDEITYSNLVSYNRAKEFVAKGEKIRPNFDEFVECLKIYRHMEFYFKNTKYGITWEDTVAFYEWDVEESIQEYATLELFYNNAHIRGVLLKDLWEKVENPDYMH